MRLRGLWGPLLREVSLFLAQSEETAERLKKMGAVVERVRVTGNLKFDVRAGEATAMTRRVSDWVNRVGAELVVAGSTLADEEEVLLGWWLDVQKAILPRVAMLLIAPRHAIRFDEVFELIRRQGYVPVRCSSLPEVGQEVFLSGNVVLLLDTIGDLASMYSVGSTAFVGGSLVLKGGHNPLEPAQFGVPVVMGESYENFREIVGAMREADAIRIVGREELGGALIELMTKREDAKAMGERGRQVFEAQNGATARTVAALMALIEGGV
jgi:3-deoxy-D-manno-octulosonic-acid transferase